MSRPWVLKVPGEPQSKARARVTKNGTYTPKRTREAEAKVADLFQTRYPRVMPDPTQAFSIELHLFRYERRPRDVDNLLKLIQDALNGVLWADDAQVEEVARVRTTWVDTRAEAATVAIMRELGREARPPRA